ELLAIAASEWRMSADIANLRRLHVRASKHSEDTGCSPRRLRFDPADKGKGMWRAHEAGKDEPGFHSVGDKVAGTANQRLVLDASRVARRTGGHLVHHNIQNGGRTWALVIAKASGNGRPSAPPEGCALRSWLVMPDAKRASVRHGDVVRPE